MDRPLSVLELEALARRVDAAFARELRAAIKRIQQGIPFRELERALLEKKIEDAIRALNLTPMQNTLAELQQILPPLRSAGWWGALEGLPKSVLSNQVVQVSMEAVAVDRPHIREAVQRLDLSRIKGISKETEDALRLAIDHGLKAGTHPTKLAREIRDLVGLNKGQVARVLKLQDRLTQEGRDPAQIDRMVVREKDRLLNIRTKSIARTEVMRAQNEGRRIQWDRLTTDNVLAKTDWERVWIGSHLESECPICSDFDGQRADIGGTFIGKSGTRTSTGPTEHPNCMCIERLEPREKEGAKKVPSARDVILGGLGRLGAAFQ